MSRFERIGAHLSVAFYAAQAVALVGGLAAFASFGEAAGRRWLDWTLPPMIALGIALVYVLPAWGAATALWKVFKDG